MNILKFFIKFKFIIQYFFFNFIQTINNLIFNFKRDYSDVKLIKLEQNYRSTKNIVSAANSVISKNKDQLDKEVWTCNDLGDKIKLYRAMTDSDEAVMVASNIQEIKLRNHEANNKFAILYRTNAQSRSMEEALRKRAVPYRIYGGLSFYQRKEVKDMIAYFRIASNPIDEEALRRIINYPKRGIGKWWEQFAGIEKPFYVSDSIKISVPPYLPNNDIVRNDMKRMYSNIVEMDGKVGLILKQLEDDNLLEETIVVFYTDHGGPLPREKRLLYDSGIRVPMIIRFPNQVRAGEVDNRLISFVDFAPTLLSMANIPPHKFHQGRAFEGKYKSKNKRKYIYAAADRFDEHYDMIRAVRDNQYKYLKNFNPEKPYYLPLEYREKMDSMQELIRMNQSGQLDNLQLQWFRNEKPKEELFDTYSDPYELRNLAGDPKYKDKLY